MTRRGKLFVISAPSGCGKTTLSKKLLRDFADLEPSVSVTTRSPRSGEIEGIDYRFVTKPIFEAMKARRAFLECEENFGYLYGTPRKTIEDSLKEGRSVLLSIDVKGAMKVRKLYPKESVLIFLMPPSLKALRHRLEFRNAEGTKELARRLNLAKREISYKDRYDYSIVNDKLENAYRKLKAIIVKERKDDGYITDR